MVNYILLFLTRKDLKYLSGILLIWVCSLNGGAVQAQVEQKPQLETGPPAAPTNPANRPATAPVVIPPDTIKPKVESGRNKKDEYQDKPSLLSKLFVGGSGDLGFSSTSYFGQSYSVFNAGISPLLGYRIAKAVAVGPGLVYNYYSFNGNSFSEYGAKVFTQIIVYKMLLIHAEHVALSSQNYNVNSSGKIEKTERYTVQSTLVGGGYRQMASDRFGFDLYLLFNVANSGNLSNNQPIIRAGFIYNLGK